MFSGVAFWAYPGLGVERLSCFRLKLVSIMEDKMEEHMENQMKSGAI